MGKAKRTLSVIMAALMLVFTCMTYAPVANAAEVLPKVSFVGLQNIPATVGEEQTLMLTSKDYTGDVQYQVFYVQRNDPNKKTAATWSKLNDWTAVADSTVPVEVKVPAGTITVAGNYSFAIRVKKAGTAGTYANDYGRYDNAYCFNYVFAATRVEGLKTAKVESATIELGQSFVVSGLTAGSSYKLFTFKEARAQKWDKDPVATTATANKLEWTPTVVGNYVLDVQLIGADGKYTAVKLFNVKVVDKLEVNSVETISATLNNPISDTYKDMVFLGTIGQVFAKAVDKDGKPVANAPILFSATKVDSSKLGAYADFVQPIAYTNNDGIAIGFLQAYNYNEYSYNAKITDSARTVTYKASVVGKNVAPVEGKVRFASLSVGTVDVTGPVDSDGVLALQPRKDAEVSYYSPMSTANMNGDPTKYVASEKVSAAGTTTNAVTFAVTPKMSYVADGASEVVSTYNKTIGWKSGAFHPYDTLTTSPVIDIPSGLKYATIYLKNLQLDENARLYVTFYNSLDAKVGTPVEVSGPINDTNRAIQVPSDKLGSITYATVSIKAAGQVNTTLNGGVEVDRVEGVYATSATTKATSVTIPNSKITWTAADTVYSETKPMLKSEANNHGIDVANAVKYLYQVPVFPFTGDAVVTAYNSNNVVLAYYFIPTVNQNNANVLKDVPALLASKNEATEKVGTLTPNADGTTVTVNSEKVGTTLLKGVIDIPGVPKDLLNATNATVYTSVNWAPIPNSTSDTAANANLFALQGQKVNIVAQLVDRNGNPATEAGETVILEPFATAGVAGVGLSNSATQTTDSNGQVKWTLSSSTLSYVKDLKATNKFYNVKLIVGSAEVTVADLYWISAQLTHQPTLDSVAMKSADVVTNSYKAIYNVGSTVEFGFKANGIVKTGNPVTGVTLSNVPVDFNKVSGTVGSADKVTDKPYVFSAKSDVAGLELVDAKIGSATDKVTVKYTTDGTNYVAGTFVGTGATSIYDKFRMPISWQSQGEQFSFIVPQGNLAAVGNTVKVFVKLTDAKGNPLSGKTVTFALTGDGTVAGINAVTNSVGIASLNVTSTVKGQSTIKAEYNGETQYFSINWLPSTTTFGIVSAGVNTVGTNDVITVSFSSDILADSVVARQFTIYDNTNGAVYAIKGVEVAGNQVKLTLADSNAHLYNKETTEYVVEYAPFTEFAGQYAGIEYNITNVDGNAIDAVNGFSTIDFYTPSNIAVKSVTLAGTTLSVSFYNGAGYSAYVVDSNGTIYTPQELIQEGLTLNGYYNFIVNPAQSYTVYCNGISYTLFNN